MTERLLTLLLALTSGIGEKTISRVKARNTLLNRTPEEFLGLSPEAMKEEYGLTLKIAREFLSDLDSGLKRAKATEAKLQGLGVQWMTSADVHYPRLLEEMDPNPPGLLFTYGNQKLLEGKTFCVLSSRSARPAELEQIERLTEEGVLSSHILVTGHDRPEYQRSALVPLRWGAPRILCLDRGLFQAMGPELKTEPFPAARLWRYEFDPRTDLVVSAFTPDAPFKGLHNQIRDRMVGCLSKRLDFVTVSPKGNMETILKMGIAASRDVRISDRCFGYRQYVAMGAQPISE